MDYGVTKRVFRDKLPLEILRGNYLTEPTKLTSLAAAADDAAIRSGMLIVKDAGSWRKAVATDSIGAASETKAFYIAVHDQDSHDAQAAGGIVGLDCSDDFEIQTGYFDTDETWVLGMPVTAGAGGILVEADATGDAIIGYVTAIGSGTGNSLAYAGKTPSTLAANSDVLQIKTARTGVVKL